MSEAEVDSIDVPEDSEEEVEELQATTLSNNENEVDDEDQVGDSDSMFTATPWTKSFTADSTAYRKKSNREKMRKHKNRVDLKTSKLLAEEQEQELPPILPPECCDEATKDADVKKLGDSMRNKMSVQWFRRIQIPPDACKRLCFSESLLMVDEVGNVSGKMYTSVSKSKFGDKQCLCVHTGSYGTPDPGMECGTTITGFVSFDMKPLQEFIHEWAVCDGKLTERKIFIMKENDLLRIQILLIKDGEVVEQKVTTLSRLEQRLLVSESGNIILLRLIMLDKRAVGEMELKTITFTGAVVKNKYVELSNGWENVRGEQVRTWSIRRTVYFEFGERLWDSMLNKHGRLILRCQPENVHALIPLWFEPVKEIKKGKGKHPGCYPPYIWACDLELYAKYLLKKDELAGEHRNYLLEHPDLRALLSDFMQAVLLRKPTNLIVFAQQYFDSFLRFRPDSSQLSEVSSSSSSNEYGSDMGEWGEWTGEGASSLRYYSVWPIHTLDGLEKVSSDVVLGENLDPELEEGDADANVTVGLAGEYVMRMEKNIPDENITLGEE